MRLFNIKLPKDGICNETQLYLRKENFAYDDNGGLIIDSGEIATFDTYFNCFSYGKYKQYTYLQNIKIKIQIKGDLTVKLIQRTENKPIDERLCFVEDEKSICRKMKFEEPSVSENVIFSSNYKCAEKEEIEFDISLSDLSGVGYIYLQLSSQNGGVFYGGEYYTAEKPLHDVKIGVVICTFKREQYVTANVQRIFDWLQKEPDYKKNLDVFVVDNGNTLTKEQVQCANLFPNKNLGGSGGFTRGIIEVLKRPDVTHFLLMDDDISFDTETLVKTLGLLHFAKDKDELCVGASMLKIKQPYFQHEMTALFGGMRLKPNHNSYDLRKPLALLKNEEKLIFNYQAWWFMCMPVGKAQKNGLPLPLFIKYDDIEYGLRNIKECAAINGIGVMHEDFGEKYSAELEYYSRRNAIIVSALYERTKCFKQFKKFVSAIAIELVYQRYFCVQNVLRAYCDFFKGAEYLMKLDGEQLHKDLRSKNPKIFSKQELEEQGFILEKSPRPKACNFKQAITLNGYLIPTCFYKNGRKSYRVVNMTKCRPQDFYKVKTVVQYNFDTQQGFVTKQKRTQLFYALGKIIKYAVVFLFKYKRTAKNYKKNFKKLTSHESWNTILFD